MKRFFSAILAVMLFVSVLTACGTKNQQGSDPPTTSSDPGQDNDDTVMNGERDNSVVIDKITYIQDTDITSLVPWDIRTMTPGIAYEIYEMLYGFEDGEFYPVLADATKGDYWPGMDHEEGSNIYTIYIYDYITDSAGNKITANDVKFSFDKARDSGFESGWGSFESETVINDTTIELHCSRELNRMGELLNILCRTFIYSEKALMDSRSGFATDACGTGPYKLKNFTASTELTVVKRDDYWQTNEELLSQVQRANVKEITLTLLHEETQKILGLETDTINLAEKFSADGVERLKADGFGDKYKTHIAQNNMIVYSYCNNDPASLCSNTALRKAILMAMDNEALTGLVGNGMVACSALGNTFYEDYDTAWENQYSLYQSPDADTIKELLDEAGYNGETLQLLTATFCGEYAEVIQGQLAEYGINVQLNIVDGGTCNALKSDPKAWDIFYQFMAADDYVVNLWSHLIDADGRPNNATENYIIDEVLQEKLHACMTEATHTAENLKDFLQYVDDNAYVKALCTGNSILVYPSNIATVFKTDKGYIVPGACTFTN